MNKNLKIALLIIITFIVISQTVSIILMNNIKEENINLIGDKVQLTYVENTGGAFGIGQADTSSFIIVSVLVIAIMLHFLIAQKDRVDKKTVVSVSLMIAGGISNLIDRMFKGAVIDYINISNLIKFPIFNLADVVIVIGWIVLIIAVIIYWKDESRKVKKLEESISKNREEMNG